MSPAEEGNPTKTPTRTPTSSPSSRPSSKPSSHPTSPPSDAPSHNPTSSTCADDVNYTSPINPNFGCGIYGILDGQCDCSIWESLLTVAQVQDLYRSCPLTCNVCEAETAIPSASPTQCADDPAYVNPVLPGLDCEFFSTSDLSCNTWGTIMTDAELQALLLSCPSACGECG